MLRLILTFLLPVFLGWSCSVERNNSPNIILLMADDLGWGDTGFNGNKLVKTPELDRLANTGVILTRFYSAAPVCSPTRASALTGRHPYRTGIYGANSGHIRSEELLLPEILKQNGYITGHFGKWHLGTLTNDIYDANRGGRGDSTIYSPPWENGFDICFSTESKVPTWDPMITPSADAGDIGKRVPGSDFGTRYWSGPGKIVTDNLEGDDSRIIMDRVIPFIRKAKDRGYPFFAVIWFHTPHLPTLTGEEYRSLYPGQNKDIQHFYGAISAMDEQVGRLARTLQEIDQFNNTLIFFTSDNGPEGKKQEGRTQGSTSGMKGRKRSLYEGGIRVPAFVCWPSAISGSEKLDIPVSTSDYLPTITKLGGISVSNSVSPLDGENIMPLLLGSTEERRTPISFQSGKQRALINGDYKIYSPDNGITYELYNILEDRGEQNDLSSVYPGIKTELINILEKWIESCKASDSGSDYID